MYTVLKTTTTCRSPSKQLGGAGTWIDKEKSFQLELKHPTGNVVLGALKLLIVCVYHC